MFQWGSGLSLAQDPCLECLILLMRVTCVSFLFEHPLIGNSQVTNNEMKIVIIFLKFEIIKSSISRAIISTNQSILILGSKCKVGTLINLQNIFPSPGPYLDPPVYQFVKNY